MRRLPSRETTWYIGPGLHVQPRPGAAASNVVQERWRAQRRECRACRDGVICLLYSSLQSSKVYVILYTQAGLREPSLLEKIPICSSFLMGRAGIEPATLGLKVPCSTD